MFPKTSRIKKNNLETVNVEFLTEKLQLVIDKEKCVGCGTCSRACPKEAIVKKELEAPVRLFGKQIVKKIKNFLIPSVRDPEKCVYCGTCMYLCPFDALTLMINGKEVKREELPLVIGKALPKIEYEIVELPSGKKAKKFGEGSITINTDLCAGGCTNCADSCPTGTIESKIIEREGYETEIRLEIFEEKCIYCGTCHNACPTGALTLTIKNIKFSGEYNSPFWDNIVERLKLKETKRD